jgi:hypothetical protein
VSISISEILVDPVLIICPDSFYISYAVEKLPLLFFLQKNDFLCPFCKRHKITKIIELPKMKKKIHEQMKNNPLFQAKEQFIKDTYLPLIKI